MNQLDALFLEGKEYVIINEVNYNDILYVHLASPNDVRDFCIRKVVNVDNKRVLIKLDNKDELKLALGLFNIEN